MAKYLSEDKSPLAYRMVEIAVRVTDSVYSAPITVYADRRDADNYARKLSMLVADTGHVRILDGDRIRAVYKKGERTSSTPMSAFYLLTKEEEEESQIWCSKTCTWF